MKTDMKKIISFIMAVIMISVCCGCQGNFGKVSLQDSIEIPADGMIKKSMIQQIKNENAIGSFYGESNGFKYEWTIFGEDITNAADINLLAKVNLSETGDVSVNVPGARSFEYPALLSVYLNEAWDALSGTAYQNEKAVASVSLTGTKQTILNISVNKSLGDFVVRADEMPVEDTTNTDIADQNNQASTEDYAKNDYLSPVKNQSTQVYKDGKDQYMTDPIPEGKPKPVEPENQEVNKGKAYTCTFSIECSTILNNLDQLDPDKLEMVPSNGTILAKTKVTFYEGESVYEVLKRICKEKGIHMESSWTPIYNSAYVEGIHNLYEFDCGSLSGWMYRVNGWYPNYGCSRYQLKDGDVVEWRYTCDLGYDVGGKNVF